MSSAGRARRASGELCRRAARDGKRLAVLLLALAASACGGARPLTRPDIVLVSLDSTRLDHLGCYGYERPTTPHLDAVAAESVVYTRARSTSSWTLPAHASLFTGQYPASHGARYDRDGPLILSQGVETTAANRELLEEIRARGLPAGERTLAAVLAEAGYDTAGVVAGPWLKRVFGLDRGFAHYDDEGIEAIGGRPADAVTDAALRWLRESRREPFFLFVHYFDPHTPYAPPRGASHAFLLDLMAEPGRKVPGGSAPRALDLYDAEIRFVDQQLGRLFDGLRALGLWEDLLLVVTADHGELFGEHGQSGHGRFLYEELVRVPLIVRYPRGEVPPRRDATPTQLVDVFSLVLRRAGVSPPPGAQGTASPEPGRPLFAEVWPPRERSGTPHTRAYYEGEEKLVWSGGEGCRLYDLGRDPGEQRDLAAEEPERCREMLERMRDFAEALPPPGPAEPERAVDAELTQALRELGYLE